MLKSFCLKSFQKNYLRPPAPLLSPPPPLLSPPPPRLSPLSPPRLSLNPPLLSPCISLSLFPPPAIIFGLRSLFASTSPLQIHTFTPILPYTVCANTLA